MVTPFPLAWPASWPRKDPAARQVGRFATRGRSSNRSPKPLNLAEARERLLGELERIRATGAVLSTDVELRLGEAPRSGREPADPGMAVYFLRGGKPYCLPCDTYTKVADNVAAVAAHLAATRAMERYGVVTLDRLIGVAALRGPAVQDGVILLPPPAKLP